jgi:lipoprotein-anchoring transpeptidase ErfK/SrfK
MGRFYLPPHVLAAVAVLAAIGVVLLLLARPAAGQAPHGAAGIALGPLSPQTEAVAAHRTVSRRPPGHEVARPRRGATIVVRARPHGKVVARLGATTEFGSPTTLAVAKRRGRWLGVITTRVANGRLGWVNQARSRLRIARTHIALTLDRSARRLVVRRGEKVLRRITVGVGRPSSPTPVGRFAVTDKLPGAQYSSAYGCCILALSAHQTSLPAGWRGGDRIAIHGTNDPSSIGAASSAGCPHASAADMRFLFRVVPLGAPVVVRP